MAVFIIINHRSAVLGRVSGRLRILVNRIPDQGPNDGAGGQTD
jgi:hypothetical protein